MAILPRNYYDRDPVVVARELIGCLLVRTTPEGICSGIIIETEAYLSVDDLASHSHRGKGKKNASMFLPAGHLYVYSIHAKYCMNAVTEGADVGSAVLIRSIQPWYNAELLSQRRGNVAQNDIARGPGRLCQAMAIDRRWDGWDLTLGEEIWIESPPPEADFSGLEIRKSPRIGISRAIDSPLRFFADRNPFVSGLRKHHSSRKCDAVIRPRSGK